MGLLNVSASSANPTPVATQASPWSLSPSSSMYSPRYTSHGTPAIISVLPVLAKSTPVAVFWPCLAFMPSIMGPIMACICLASSSVIVMYCFFAGSTIIITFASLSHDHRAMAGAEPVEPDLPALRVLNERVLLARASFVHECDHAIESGLGHRDPRAAPGRRPAGRQQPLQDPRIIQSLLSLCCLRSRGCTLAVPSRPGARGCPAPSWSQAWESTGPGAWCQRPRERSG